MPQESTNCLTISAAFKAARDDESGPKITRATIARALNCSETQAGRWLDGEHDDRFEQYQHACADFELGRLFAYTLLCRSSLTVVGSGAALVRDVDGDGRTGKGDVMAGALESIRLLTEQASLIQECAGGTKYTEAQNAEIQNDINKARAMLDSLSATAHALTYHAGPRSADQSIA